MIFLKETDYFSTNPLDPVFWRKAITETAVAVAGVSKHYKFDLWFPKKGIQKLHGEGELPADAQERDMFVRKLIDSLIDQSETYDWWDLYLDDKPLTKHPSQTKLYYNNCSWDLALTAPEFRDIQAAWERVDLPTDLFYWEEEGVCETRQATGIWRYLIGHYQRCYSPREWAKYQKESNP